MKRLCVFADGTWQSLENEMPTNVVFMLEALKCVASDGVEQMAFYYEGIGEMDSVVSRTLQGATGSGIVRVIKALYRQLAMNYEPGDEIYMFGFSRGAFVVRSLANFLHNVGLTLRHRCHLIDEAYALYQDNYGDMDPPVVKFRNQYGVVQPPIRLVAVYDTVRSLGLPPTVPASKRVGAMYEHHQGELTPSVDIGIHACSVDENRESFNVEPMVPIHDKQRVRTMFFPGGHTACGGGVKDEVLMSNAALLWMLDEIERTPGADVQFDRTLIPRELNDLRVDPCIDFRLEAQLARAIRAVGGTNIRHIDSPNDVHETCIQRWNARIDYRPESLMKHAKNLGLSTVFEVCGALKINIISAEGLAGKRRDDHYCKVILDEQELVKTHVCKNTNAPVWNFSDEVHFEGYPSSGAVLSFQVYDRDRLSRDDFKGMVDISLASICQGKPGGKTTYDLVGMGNRKCTQVSGVLVLDISFVEKQPSSNSQGWKFKSGKICKP